jgi:hypothetical protein
VTEDRWREVPPRLATVSTSPVGEPPVCRDEQEKGQQVRTDLAPHAKAGRHELRL